MSSKEVYSYMSFENGESRGLLFPVPVSYSDLISEEICYDDMERLAGYIYIYIFFVFFLRKTYFIA